MLGVWSGRAMADGGVALNGGAATGIPEGEALSGTCDARGTATGAPAVPAMLAMATVLGALLLCAGVEIATAAGAL